MFTGFTDEDFEVFEVPGLELRMEALKSTLRPKLAQLGTDFSAWLGEQLQTPIYAHVAKHARRTTNPPNDSWVAFCTDKRGYKKHPHFQIGAWETHAFATFGYIYEAPDRVRYAQALQKHAQTVVQMIPDDFVWIPDHMNPQAYPANSVDSAQLCAFADRLANRRQGELLVGKTWSKATAVALSGAQFEASVQACYQTLLPLYQLATGTEVVFA